jgi:hypothetical protein
MLPWKEVKKSNKETDSKINITLKQLTESTGKQIKTTTIEAYLMLRITISAKKFL